MLGFWTKRPATIPPNMPDNHSEVFSHSSTLKMESTDGGITTNSRTKRPRASIIIGIILLFLLAGISVAAGICYLNHMRTINDISRWVDNGAISPVSSTATVADGLGKRQQYSYGHPVPANVTSSVAATVKSTSTTTATDIGTTVSASGSFFETAPGIPVTISPLSSGIHSTITQTITSQSNYTVFPSVHSTSGHKNATGTFQFNSTITLDASTPTLSSVINTLTITSTGIAMTETLTSDEVSTTTHTVQQNITVSVGRTTTVAESPSPSVVTITVSGTVVPIPASPTTVVTAAGVTGAPAWTTDSSGWNSTISSSLVRPTASNDTSSLTITAPVDSSTSCTESMGSTVTSNDAITASVNHSHSSSASSLSSSIVSSLSTIVAPPTVSPSLINSTTTCTESMTSTLSQQLTSASETFYTTETETIAAQNTTKTLTITVVKSTTVSEPGDYSAKGVTTPTPETTTSIVQITVTETPTLPAAESTCAPVVTVTITATTVQTVVVMPSSKGHFSTMVNSMTPESARTVKGDVVSAPNIPLISISPNTTVIVSAPHHETILASTKTVIENMTKASTDALSTSMHASYASGGMMSHGVSELSTSTSTATAIMTTHATVGNGTGISMQGSGTGISVIYSTQTVMGNHTSTGIPIVPVSAGSKRAGPFGGSSTTGSTQTAPTGACIIMLVAVFSFLNWKII